jgi:hypothetical protein
MPRPPAAGDHGDPGNLRSELRRNVAGHQFSRLHNRGVERVGERAGKLVADWKAIHDERHLVVSTAWMNRAVCILGEAGKGDEYGFEATAADRGRQPFDALEPKLRTRSCGCRVHEERIAGRHRDG